MTRIKFPLDQAPPPAAASTPGQEGATSPDSPQIPATLTPAIDTGRPAVPVRGVNETAAVTPDRAAREAYQHAILDGADEATCWQNAVRAAIAAASPPAAGGDRAREVGELQRKVTSGAARLGEAQVRAEYLGAMLAEARAGLRAIPAASSLSEAREIAANALEASAVPAGFWAASITDAPGRPGQPA